MVNADIFNYDERVIINGICKNESLSELKKSDVETSLLFSLSVTDEEDEDFVNLFSGLHEKVQNLSEAEWDELKMLTPFFVPYGVEGDVDEIPDDEDEI